MTETWMKKHLVSVSNYNIVNLQYPNCFTRNDIKKMLGCTFSVDDTARANLQWVLSKINIISDTKWIGVAPDMLFEFQRNLNFLPKVCGPIVGTPNST